jgi:hypothetical protein
MQECCRPVKGCVPRDRTMSATARHRFAVLTPMVWCRRSLVCVLFGLGLNACGGSNPAGPSYSPPPPGTPAIVAISIQPPGHVLSGSEVVLNVLAVLQGGTSRPIAPTLTSSSPSTVTVGAGTAIMGKDVGTATITATYQGFTATRAITVEPDYAGVWTQRYNVITCTDERVLRTADWCRRLTSGSLPVMFALQRLNDDAGFRSLDGIAVWGSVPSYISLHVNDDGTASGSYSFVFPPSFPLEIGDERVLLYSPVSVPLSLRWEQYSLRGSWPTVTFYPGGLARQQIELAPGAAWDPHQSPPAMTAFPPVTAIAELLDRFTRP